VCKNRSNELTNLSLSNQPTINLPYDGDIHKNAIEMCIHVQGVIKIRKDVLSRKPQRHLKMICTGWNCVFRNSKFTAFQPMIDANEEQMKWSEMVKKLQRKRLLCKKFDTDWIVAKKCPKQSMLKVLPLMMRDTRLCPLHNSPLMH
jgi:hypothetical protein